MSWTIKFIRPDTRSLGGEIINYLHFYLLAVSILEKEFHPGLPIIRGAFKLRELISPKYGL